MDDPPPVDNSDQGIYDWDGQNRTYLSTVTYRCPSSGWGYPSTGTNTMEVFCGEDGKWSEDEVEFCASRSSYSLMGRP